MEAYFLGPDISNPDDLCKLLTVANNAGGLTPNMAHELAVNAIGKDKVAEDYAGDWANLPLIYSRQQLNLDGLRVQLQEQITKAAGNHDDAVVAVMKEVKNLLLKMEG